MDDPNKIDTAKNLAAQDGLLHISVWLDQQNLLNHNRAQDIFKELNKKISKVYLSMKKAEAEAIFGGPVKKCSSCNGQGGYSIEAGDHCSYDECETCKGTGFELIKK